MSYSAIKTNPEALAGDVCRVVERSRPDRAALQDLARQLLARHAALRLRPVVSSEETVEAYFRCAIAGAIAGQHGLEAPAVPACINSSHQAVRRVCAVTGHRHADIEDEVWQRGWDAMQRDHSEVNVPGTGRAFRRADLYLVARGGVVSLEFKYVGDAGIRDEAALARQTRRHAEHHAEALLVLYSDSPIPGRVVDRLTERIGRPNVRVLNPVGPRIEVARGDIPHRPQGRRAIRR